MYVCMCVCMYGMYVCMYMHVCEHRYVCMHIYVYMYIYMYVLCMCIYICIYVCIYIYMSIYGCALCVLGPPPPMVSPPKPPQIQGPEASRPKGLPLEARTVGGGDAAGSRAQNRGGGGRGCRRSRGISCSTRGGGAGRIHHDVHYLLKYKST